MEGVLVNILGGGVIGGFLGSLIIWRLDQSKEVLNDRRKLLGALKALSSELLVNKTSFEIALEGKSPIGPVRHKVYKDIVLLLATELDDTTYMHIAGIYESLALFEASAKIVSKNINKNTTIYKRARVDASYGLEKINNTRMLLSKKIKEMENKI